MKKASVSFLLLASDGEPSKRSGKTTPLQFAPPPRGCWPATPIRPRLEALAEAAGDNSWIVQMAAFEALAKRGDPSALPTVVHYLSDEKGAIKFTAAAAVIHLSAVKQAHPRKPRETTVHKP